MTEGAVELIRSPSTTSRGGCAFAGILPVCWPVRAPHLVEDFRGRRPPKMVSIVIPSCNSLARSLSGRADTLSQRAWALAAGPRAGFRPNPL